jgi:hypothetical protein
MASQKISEQIELDDSVMELLLAIEDALNLTPKANIEDLKLCLEKSTNRKTVLSRMMDLITECAYFIQSYVTDINFCMYLSSLHPVMFPKLGT